MQSLIFIKLGGSLITDKRKDRTYRRNIVESIGHELNTISQTRPDLRMLLGHGSGSFGHMIAKQHNTINGVHSPEQWRGFAQVGVVASELNQLVANTLIKTKIPVWRIQPSASAVAENGILQSMSLTAIATALEQGLVPLVYGDIAIDTARGGTIISTETIFFYLAQHFPVNQIVLLGEVDGVYDATGQVIPVITPANFDNIKQALQGASGVDVTGGMYTKVADMLHLAETVPGLNIRIVNGTEPSILRQILIEEKAVGTSIRGM